AAEGQQVRNPPSAQIRHGRSGGQGDGNCRRHHRHGVHGVGSGSQSPLVMVFSVLYVPLIAPPHRLNATSAHRPIALVSSAYSIRSWPWSSVISRISVIGISPYSVSMKAVAPDDVAAIRCDGRCLRQLACPPVDDAGDAVVPAVQGTSGSGRAE